MALRILLVALVVSLGLDLPEVQELEAWEHSGREWLAARMPDFSTLRIEAERTQAGPHDRAIGGELVANSTGGIAQGRVELAFEAAVEAMASGFSADLDSMGSSPATGAWSAGVEPHPDPVVAGLSTSEGSRLEKLSEAVRLTRRAVDAWSDLIQPVAEPASDEGRDDSL